MKVFSQLVESVSSEGFALTQEEFDKYKAAIEQTKRSKEFLRVMWIIAQMPLLFDKENLQKVLSGRFFKELDESMQKDLQRICKKIGDEVKLLPQFLSASQREGVISKKFDVNDLMLDLETSKGRDAIVKRYLPLVEKIIKQWDGKSNLSKEELRSSALLGLVDAMNNYKNPEEMAKAGKEGNQSFTQYAAYRMKQQILKDMTEYGTDVKISNHFRKKITAAGDVIDKEFSIDSVFGSDEDGEPISIDRFLGLSADDDQFSYREKQELYKKIFKRIESKFSARDCNMFYRVWGINGFKHEKVKDLAKELGISEPAVTQACKRIIRFAASDREIQSYKDAFESLIDDYVCSKMFEVYTESKQTIIEAFMYDDMYLFMESLNKWNNKDKFIKVINNASDHLNIDDALYIYHILENNLDIVAKDFKKHRAAVIEFLENVYPEKAFKQVHDDILIDELKQLRSVSEKFQIKW